MASTGHPASEKTQVLAVMPGSHLQAPLEALKKEHLRNPCLEHNTQMQSHVKLFISNCPFKQMNL